MYTHSNRSKRSYQKGKTSRNLKGDFVQTNFRYVIDPNFKCDLSHSDTLVPWKYVKVVLFTPDDEYRCPICLETPSAPKITSCGHIFCYPCLIHLFSGYDIKQTSEIISNLEYQSCPMCNQEISLSLIKMVDIMRLPQRNIGEYCEFILLKKSKFGTIPLFPDNEDSDTLPYYSESHSCYSRFQLLDPAVPEKGYFGAEVSLLKREKIQVLSAMEFVDKSEQLYYQLALESTVCRLEILHDCLEDHSWGEKKYHQYNFNSNDKKKKEQRNRNKISNMRYFYFYQDQSGKKLFIHPSSQRQLVQKYGSFDSCPKIIQCKIESIIDIEVTNQSKNEFKLISHLPNSSSCQLCTILIE